MTREGKKHTKDILADALREIGLHEMAGAAATGYYHDFLSPLDLPEMQLDADLVEKIRVARSFGNMVLAKQIDDLRKRHHNGDFDASKEESDAWVESEDGRIAFALLTGGTD